MVSATIDNIKIEVPENTTILDAAKKIGVRIPTLCYWKDLNDIGACRVCLVEVEGYDRLLTACNNVVEEGMVIRTDSRRAKRARKNNVQLILSQHKDECPTCVRSGNCSLQTLANNMNLEDSPFEKELPAIEKSDASFPLIRDYTKCIKCLRCIQVCDKIQHVNVWDVVNSGGNSTVDVADYYTLKESDCALCGQCITHCPVGALVERDDTEVALHAIYDENKTVVVQIAPAIRTAWGEPFGMNAEEATIERLASCLKRIGVDYVFDTNFTADLTIMEEANEFLERVKDRSASRFPMFTSCCPGWVRFIKSHYPEYVDNLSSAKSPQQMFGAVAKSYYAEILGKDPKDIFVVSIMPCLAKKHECAIPAMNDACGDPDVDVSLTTREVDRLIRMAHIDPKLLEDTPLDMPLGVGSGAGNIFGATGGVMEAALRTAYFAVTGKNPDPDAFMDVRGMDGWKEVSFDLAGTTLRIAVVNGLGNADNLLKALKHREVMYDFVEVMACPGGCVGGGGQPIHDGYSMKQERADVLYTQDKNSNLRFSHENPSIKAIYEDYLGEPLSEKSEHLLHTDHHAWKMPNED